MAGRTFAVGDVHGDLASLRRLLSSFPALTGDDTLVFVGDYLDRGPSSAQVVDFVRRLPSETPARVVALRGNHEDAWLRVLARGGWPDFVRPLSNGCLATMRSYTGDPAPAEDEPPRDDEIAALHKGTFFPQDVIRWMRNLPFHYEDEHAIFVHAGLPRGAQGFLHPADTHTPQAKLALLWCRDRGFVEHYRGKLVVFGHTPTKYLPPELSTYTPDDLEDLWVGPNVVGLDTGCGKGGFLTGIELPAMKVYETR